MINEINVSERAEIEDKLVKLEMKSSEMNALKCKLSKAMTRIDKNQSWGYPLDWELKRVDLVKVSVALFCHREALQIDLPLRRDTRQVESSVNMLGTFVIQILSISRLRVCKEVELLLVYGSEFVK